MDRASREFIALLSRDVVRIERVVSQGRNTPEDNPHGQDHGERVPLPAGNAGLWLEGEAGGRRGRASR